MLLLLIVYGKRWGPGAVSSRECLHTVGPNSTTVVVAAHTLGKPEWAWHSRLVQTGYNVLIYTHGRDGGSGHSVPVNRGNEASAYLLYILEHYDNLAPYTAFLHNHEHSWHHRGSLVDVIHKWEGTAPVAVDLGNHTWSECSLRKWGDDFWAAFNAWLGTIIGKYFSVESCAWKNGAYAVGRTCCAQFIVRRDVIRANPLSLYQELYQWVSHYGEEGGPTPGHYLELVWPLLWRQVPGVDLKPATQ